MLRWSSPSTAPPGIAFRVRGTMLIVLSLVLISKSVAEEPRSESNTSTFMASPLDRLDASVIPNNLKERWHPREVVAVMKQHVKGISSLAFSPDGRILASGSFDDTVRLWKLDGAQPIEMAVLRTPGGPAVAFSSDGKSLVTAGHDSTIRVRAVGKTRNKGAIASLRCGEAVWSLGVGEGDILVCGLGNSVEVRDLGDDKLRLLATLKANDSASRGAISDLVSVCISSDGRRIVSAGNDKSLRAWQFIDGQISEVFTNKTNGWVSLVDMSSDGRTIVSTRDCFNIDVWNVVGDTVSKVTTLSSSFALMERYPARVAK